ncbi:phosphonopyruvate decarboxylase [Natronoglycomyces albus]|uniref:Phosphonopyruvate decarboxylase n=1 Tax=Natronoglycomyces albus TaxID=2811108 RepID=A0A895XRA7_9ACTN|nr:phosphonopyruvate decarboxylase [Natronoglycomyces albus]QSB04800.1 phosphonopyruvate decarboxylase [Natronoglycomyces albus]
MIEPYAFVDQLTRRGVSLYTGVPDSLLKQLGSHIQATLPREQHVICANEGAAVGLAIGHYLQTSTPAMVYLQNSGFGNLVNPVLSLADPDVYGVPMVIVVGWRGQPGVKDEPQHVKQGKVQEALLEALDLPWAMLPKDPAEAEKAVDLAYDTAMEHSTPYFLLVEKGTFSDGIQVEQATPELPSREDALIAAADAVGTESAIISTTGMLSRELFEYRERAGESADRDFLTVGGMGHASSIALGVAKAAPERETWCFDGDGALLMHMGSLPVIADHAGENYFHLVFNNGVHDSVGGQPTSAAAMDMAQTALAVGYRWAQTTSELSQLPRLIAQMRAAGGPALLELQVKPGNRAGIGRPTRTPRQTKTAFMQALRDH